MTKTNMQCCHSDQSCTSAKLQPLGNRVLVRRLAAEEKLKGGIILPDSAKKKQEQAEVVAVGKGKRDAQNNLIPVPVKVGDVILMEKYSGQDVTLADEEFVIVRSDDIIAIVEK
jgi:chaperonin GroES